MKSKKSKGSSNMTRSLDLKQLITPIAPKEFFAEYWEKKPLLSRNKSVRYQGLITLHDVEFLLFTCLTPHPWVRFVNNKQEYNSEDYFSVQPSGNKLPDRQRIAEGFRDGDTIVLNHLQERWEPIKKLCYNLEGFFGVNTWVNMYLTPGSAQGFRAHRDAEDVFILQVEGKKLWKLYDYPLDYPLPGHDRKIFYNIDRAPALEVVLKPGDCLYIPRGYVHEAQTANDYSLHLTVGVYARSWVELLKTIALNEPLLRHSLPRNFLMPTGKLVVGKEELSPQVDLLNDPKTAAKNLEHLRQKFLEGRTDSFFGNLSSIVHDMKHSKIVKKGKSNFSKKGA